MKSPVRRRGGWAYALLPGLVLLAFVFGYPMVVLVQQSLSDPSPANYQDLATSEVVWRVLWNTFRMSVVVLSVTVVAGVLYAYVIARSRPLQAGILLLLIVFPMLTSWVVRTLGVQLFIQDSGLINQMLGAAGTSPVELIRNDFGMTVGMIYILLPYMVLPIYAVMREINPDLMTAACGLGASRWRAFRMVYLPLSVPGIIAGSVVCLSLSLGFFVVPTLLGSPFRPVLSGWIYLQFTSVLQFGLGAAAAVALIALVSILFWIAARFVPFERLVGLNVDK